MVRFENFFRDGDYLEADVIAIDAGNARYHARYSMVTETMECDKQVSPFAYNQGLKGFVDIHFNMVYKNKKYKSKVVEVVWG